MVKISLEKLFFFCSNYVLLVFCKNMIWTLVFEKNAIFRPKIGINCRKLWP
jgi:hypothetical protein